MDPSILIGLIMLGYLSMMAGTVACVAGLYARDTIAPNIGVVFNILGIILMGVGFYGIMCGPGW